jgi:hypothetical protein
MKPLRPVEFIHGLNAPRENFVSNIERNMGRTVDTLKIKRAMLVAGGPSAADHIEEIRTLYGQGWDLFCVNGAHDWLVSHGVIPHFCTLLDAGEEIGAFVRKPQSSCRYFLASQCHPSAFDRLADYDVMMWHASLDEEANALIEKLDPDVTIFAPCNTVGLHSLAIAYTLGVKKLRVYGMDSSHRPGADHAYDNSQQKHTPELEFEFNGERFLSTGTFAAQAEGFARAWPRYFRLGMRIEVVGDGLLPAMARLEKSKLMAELTGK